MTTKNTIKLKLSKRHVIFFSLLPFLVLLLLYVSSVTSNILIKMSIFAFFGSLYHASIQVIRDLYYQNVSIIKFFEAPIFGTILVLLLYKFFNLYNLGAIAVSSLVFQRILLEPYKIFARKRKKEDAIPALSFWKMDFVYNRVWGILTFIVVYISVMLAFYYITLYGDALLSQNKLYAVPLSFTVGLTIALSGVYKDVPMEGFKLFSFFRSIVFAHIGALILIGSKVVSGSFITLMGLERLNIEISKLLFGKVIRGYTEGKASTKITKERTLLFITALLLYYIISMAFFIEF